MEEKQLETLPPSYTNLGFDDQPSPGPSAPANIADISESNLQKDFIEPPPSPSAPSPYVEDLGPSTSSPYIEDLGPSTSSPYEEDLGPPPMFYSSPSLVFEEIYEACVVYAKKHCCYGTRFVNQMKLNDIVNKVVFYYTLESFGEKRESASKETAYRGGAIDGPENGPPPNPWDMRATPPVMFMKCNITIQIPHTEHVRICPRCDGIGKVTCSSCSGSGYRTCWSCSGSGRNSDNNSCSSCSGSGRDRCIWCSGSGRTTCSRCDGYGKIKSYRVLIVTWKNHFSEYITDTDNMPNKLIPKAEGTELLSQTERSLLPIPNAPDPNVNIASATLLERHQVAFPNELIIQQRQILRVVPLTRVTYTWKEKDGEFYVYGNNRKVFFEDYPQKCCCCTCC